VGVKVGVANIFLGQSIGIDESNTFQLFYSIFYYSSISIILASKL